MESSVIFLEKPGSVEEVKLQEIVANFIDAIRTKAIDTLQEIIASNARMECQIAKYEVVDKQRFIRIVEYSYLRNLSYTDVRLQLKDHVFAVSFGIIKVRSLLSSVPKYFAVYLEKTKGGWRIIKTEYIGRKNNGIF
ncbi:MAG: hypothetical protein WAP51_04525 [Candidatus Sungiibacteriota bacterium]